MAPAAPAVQLDDLSLDERDLVRLFYEHTAGPWMIFNGGDIGSAAVRRPETIVLKAGSIRGETIGEAMKNARLIAAAPELLEALKQIVNEIINFPGEFNADSEIVSIARATIAKAEGKA